MKETARVRIKGEVVDVELTINHEGDDPQSGVRMIYWSFKVDGALFVNESDPPKVEVNVGGKWVDAAWDAFTTDEGSSEGHIRFPKNSG